jgi:DNA-binding SARP family transcriptional activator
MAYLRLIDSAQRSFGELAPEANIVILHPQFRYHNALVDALLSARPGEVVYLNLASHVGLPAMWEALRAELESDLKIKLPAWADESPEAAGDKLAKAVAKLDWLSLVVAAYDQADDAIHAFILAVAARLRGRGMVLLDGRSWPRQLVDMAGGTAGLCVLPASVDDMLLDYLSRDKERVMLEVRALGSGQVLINGRQINQWDGALPRALFFYFVDRGMTTRDEVFATFWPDLSTREATNVFHVTKRKISEILDVDLTVYSSGFYRISPQIDLFYDVVAFAEAVQNSAVAEPDEARLLLERAISLHERDFLSDFDQAWAVRRREELRRTYVDALSALGRLCEEENQLTEALGLYSRAFGRAPQREDLARAQMRLFAQAGHRDKALAVCDRLIEELRTSLGVDPSPETIALAEELRHDHP